jgi:hypothetical protein
MQKTSRRGAETQGCCSKYYRFYFMIFIVIYLIKRKFFVRKLCASAPLREVLLRSNHYAVFLLNNACTSS